MRNVNNLATTFAKIIKEDATATKDSTVYGTAVEFNGKMYVKLDGSERMTPIETTTSIKEGDRVTVLIKATKKAGKRTMIRFPASAFISCKNL